MTRLFTAPAVRGRGLGAVLLDAVVGFAAEHQLQLWLDVVEDGGAAVALYDRLGWRFVERRLANWTTPDGVQLPLRVYLAPVSRLSPPAAGQ